MYMAWSLVAVIALTEEITGHVPVVTFMNTVKVVLPLLGRLFKSPL